MAAGRAGALARRAGVRSCACARAPHPGTACGAPSASRRPGTSRSACPPRGSRTRAGCAALTAGAGRAEGAREGVGAQGKAWGRRGGARRAAPRAAGGSRRPRQSKSKARGSKPPTPGRAWSRSAPDVVVAGRARLREVPLKGAQHEGHCSMREGRGGGEAQGKVGSRAAGEHAQGKIEAKRERARHHARERLDAARRARRAVVLDGDRRLYAEALRGLGHRAHAEGRLVGQAPLADFALLRGRARGRRGGARLVCGAAARGVTSSNFSQSARGVHSCKRPCMRCGSLSRARRAMHAARMRAARRRALISSPIAATCSSIGEDGRSSLGR